MNAILTGRELDTAVAEKVFGWRALPGNWRNPIWVDPGYPESGETHGSDTFSSDLAAAWKVVDHLRAQGWIVRVQEMPDGEPFRLGSGWDGQETRLEFRAMCSLHSTPTLVKRRGGPVYSPECQFGHTPAEAICRAALQAATAGPATRGSGA